jgi:rhodanese-related sulfurtransferase
VGRPDLAQEGNVLTMEDLAGMLYDSIQLKIMPLPDDVLVYPAHGPGSSCGKNLGPNTYSTIGEEKRSNYALQAGSKAAFVKAVTEGLAAPPQYFPVNAKINKEGYESLDKLLAKALQPISIAAFKEKIKDESVIILDTRDSVVFINGFIPGAVSIGLDGRFAEWAGMLLPFDKPILMVTDTGKEEETAVRLARVGFSTVEGYLEGSYAAWLAAGEKIDMIVEIEADELAMDLPHDTKMLVVDVRRETEFADGHIKGAVNIPLSEMTDPASMADLDENKNIYVHCAGGYRSIIAASLLKRQGIHNLHNVQGGWAQIKEQKGVQVVKETSVLN